MTHYGPHPAGYGDTEHKGIIEDCTSPECEARHRENRAENRAHLKRITARTLAVAITLLFIVGVSAGAYYDAGGWAAVAVVWASVVVLAGLIRVLVWATDNWNAR
ncbi:hypothetical protein [Streptomyces sp. NPDC006551]|uniref:hypothetical protein n=1 Tax=Streptomyces sp. NPDC006551 TaxID=3157178 RepID=UPI0033B3D867